MKRSLIALGAGALLPFAFAPFYGYWLAFISPAILLACWRESSPKSAALQGFFFGLGFFGVGISWVFISVHEFGNTNVLLAGIITAGLVSFLSLFFMLSGWFFRFWFRSTYISALLVFPAIWALSEWLRSWLLTGFPWLLLGFSQTQGPIAPLAPIIGVYGLSFLCCLISAALYFSITKLMEKPEVSILMVMIIVALTATGVSLRQHTWTTPIGKPFKVALVQGNIPQQEVWTNQYFNSIINTYVTLTTPLWNNSLIIWPESAIPAPESSVVNFINALDKQAKEKQATLIFGIPVMNASGSAYYNSMVSVGRDKNTYAKRHLVPFGEYLPFEKLLRGLINFFDIPMSNMEPGHWRQPAFHFQNYVIGTFICYEIAYAEIVRSELPKANLLVTISNDAWFGHSFALAQHLQMAQFRSLQTGRYQAMVGNNGLTALINNTGKITKQVPAYIATTLVGTLQAMSGSTPWVRWGNLWLIISLFVLCIVARLVQRPSMI